MLSSGNNDVLVKVTDIDTKRTIKCHKILTSGSQSQIFPYFPNNFFP